MFVVDIKRSRLRSSHQGLKLKLTSFFSVLTLLNLVSVSLLTCFFDCLFISLSVSGYLFVKRTNLEVTILKITVLVLNKFVRPHLVL